MIVAAKRDQQLVTCLGSLLILAIAVRTHPDAHARADIGGRLDHGSVSVGILARELGAVQGFIRALRAVQVPRIPCVNVKLHAKGVTHPLEVFQIDQRLRLGRALVCIVDPRKILRVRRRFFVRARGLLGFFDHNISTILFLILILLYHKLDASSRTARGIYSRSHHFC